GKNTLLYGADSQKPSAGFVLVPHTSSRRELQTSVGWHVWRPRDRRNRVLFSCANWAARGGCGCAWSFDQGGASGRRFEAAGPLEFGSLWQRARVAGRGHDG